MTEDQPYQTVLLLANNPELAMVDRQLLKIAEIRLVGTLFAGVEAAQYFEKALERNELLPSFILCHEQLEDMNGQAFIALMRNHPAFMALPILVTVNDKNTRIHGSSGTLLRPYTLNDLTAQLQFAEQCQKATLKALGNMQGRLSNSFKAGLTKYIRKHEDIREALEMNYDGAAIAFTAGDCDTAIMHLQRCLKLKPDHVSSKNALEKVLAEKARRSQQHRVSAAQKIQAQNVPVPIQKKDALSSLPLFSHKKDVNQSLPQPIRTFEIPSLEEMEHALEDTFNVDYLNVAMQKQATSKVNAPLIEPTPSSFLSKYPKLQDIVTVIRVTIKLLKRL